MPPNGGATDTLLTGPSGENVTVTRPAPDGPSELLHAVEREVALASAARAEPTLNEER